MFQEALARCERGESGGIVVARLDRFARSAVDALESIKRLNAAGARLVSVEDNFDGSTPMGRFAIGILTLIAELELERIRESWSTAAREAVGRGVHISPRPPSGYRRDENGRLHLDEPAAPAVAEVFRRRALGSSWAELARYLDELGVRPPTGNPHWSKVGVAGLIKNPVYLGQARGGDAINDHAHEPLVTRAEFDAAQSVKKSLLRPRDGSIATRAMLGGLARCAGCGHTLKITGSTDRKTGERFPIYYCTGRYATGLCPARASARAAILDAYVEKQVLQALEAEDGLLAQAVAASEAIEAAARAVAEAEHELDLFVNNPKLLTVLGEQKFLEGRRDAPASLRPGPTGPCPAAAAEQPGRGTGRRGPACRLADPRRAGEATAHARPPRPRPDPARRPPRPPRPTDQRARPDRPPRRHDPHRSTGGSVKEGAGRLLT
jgi:site-specific DNA recombinase